MFANDVILPLIDGLEHVVQAQGVLEVQVIYLLIDSYIEYTAQSRAGAADTCVAAVGQVIRISFLRRTHMYSVHVILRVHYVTRTVQHASCTGLLTGVSPPTLSTILVSYVWFTLLCPRHVMIQLWSTPYIGISYFRYRIVITFRLERF